MIMMVYKRSSITTWSQRLESQILLKCHSEHEHQGNVRRVTFEKAYRHDTESAELTKNRIREYAHPDSSQRTQRK
jgi:hypothetical protein